MSPFAERIRTEAGTGLAPDGSVHFGDAAAIDPATTGCRVPLLDCGVVVVAGADAQTFLHAQLVSDLARAEPAAAPLSAWCSPQGRVQFLLRVVRHGERFLLLLPRADVPRLVQRLRMFVLRARVTIEDASEDFALFGRVPDAATPAPPPAVGAPATVAEADGLIVIGLESSPPRELVLGPSARIAAAWAASTLPAAGTATWRWLDVRSGLPWLPAALAGRFLPQELNLDWLGAMSYSKGCYPGQEVIARVRFRGAVKRRLLCGRADDRDLAIGTPLRRPDGSPGERDGEVLFATAAPDGHAAVQLVAAPDALASGLVTDDGATLALERPPYWREGD